MELLNIINVKTITKKSLSKELKRYHFLPSLLEISSMLSKWNIGNMLISDISLENLAEAPTPIIAVTNRQEPFIIKDIIGDNYYCLFQNSNEEKIIEKNDFESLTKGVYLLIEANKFSGEINFEKKKNKNLFDRKIFSLISAFIILITSIGFFKTKEIPLIFYVLSIIGFALSTYLLLKEYSFFLNSPYGICRIGKRFDCDSVITSKESKILGFSIAEITTGVFLFFILYNLYGSINNISQSYLVFFVYSSLIGVFYSYYQQIKIKKYCFICIIISLILIAQTLLAYNFYNLTIIRYIDFFHLILVFSLAALITLLIKSSLSYKKDLSLSEDYFYNLLYSELLIYNGHNPHFQNQYFQNEIQIGDINSNFEIIMFSNPLCKRCKEISENLLHLFSEFEEQVFLRILYSGPPYNNDKAKNLHAELYLRTKGLDNEQKIKFISDFDLQKFHDDRFFEKAIMDEFTSQYEWSNDLGFEGTPALILNGIRLPSLFGIEELCVFLRNTIE